MLRLTTPMVVDRLGELPMKKSSRNVQEPLVRYTLRVTLRPLNSTLKRSLVQARQSDSHTVLTRAHDVARFEISGGFDHRPSGQTFVLPERSMPMKVMLR
jgi:hypothetical protein